MSTTAKRAMVKSEAEPWPTDIAYDAAEKCLRVVFDSGESFNFSAEYLRVESPSAEMQGHSPTKRVILPSRRHVGIIDMEQVGNYAVRIVFDDLHDTGIFSWRYLHQLGGEHESRWQTYLDALAAKGLSREP